MKEEFKNFGLWGTYIEFVITESYTRPKEVSLRLDKNDPTASPFLRELNERFNAGDKVVMLLKEDFEELTSLVIENLKNNRKK